VETNMMLWVGSYLYKVKGMEPPLAASWVSVFLACITAGRFLTGFLTFRMSNNRIIFIGMTSILVGVILMIVPLPFSFTLAGILFIGLGCAPIFPCMIHETPVHFGSSASQSIMGFQMASAYIGVTFLPSSIGFITSHFSMKIFPLFIFVFACFIFLFFLILKKQTGTAVKSIFIPKR
ncbi:MAG: MFS transporter, partial [Fibrobacter sp.]|nr:MFS transporter [Fibrobacter sp.]